MLKRFIAIIFGVVAVAVLTALVSESRNGEVRSAKLGEPAETQLNAVTGPNYERPRQQTAGSEIIDPGYFQKSEKLRTAIRKIDFANFSYPAEPIYRTTGFRLRDGAYKGHRMPRAVAPWGPAPIGLVAIAYGDVTGDGHEDAMVVLTESLHGTAIPYYVYVYELKANHPARLLWAVETGDRAEGGLKRAYAENAELVIELYGQGARVNERLYGTNISACCPLSFTRTRYRWAKSHFVRRGESEIIPLSEQSASLEMEYRPRD